MWMFQSSLSINVFFFIFTFQFLGQPFTSKSDVFSFSVLCYEIFAYGEIPYKDMSNKEAADFVKSGGRLKMPENTPNTMKMV